MKELKGLLFPTFLSLPSLSQYLRTSVGFHYLENVAIYFKYLPRQEKKREGSCPGVCYYLWQPMRLCRYLVYIFLVSPSVRQIRHWSVATVHYYQQYIGLFWSQKGNARWLSYNVLRSTLDDLREGEEVKKRLYTQLFDMVRTVPRVLPVLFTFLKLPIRTAVAVEGIYHFYASGRRGRQE